MDRYAVDGSPFCPAWMADAHQSSQHSINKKKGSAAKTSRWSEGYSMTHSAYGYGNETVLCNDPHANPLTDLDNADLVQKAWDRTNIDIKICRIGPWVFPIEVTTCFLPKGSPLLFFYQRGYWATLRADQALATLADDREATFRREQEQMKRENKRLRKEQKQIRQQNEDLWSHLRGLHHKHGEAALQLVQASPDAGTALAALSIPDQQSKPALKHEARSCATASQLLPPGKPNPGFGNGPSATISDFTALLKSDQNAQANSNLQHCS